MRHERFVVNARLKRLLNALAFDNIGNTGELWRRLEVPRESLDNHAADRAAENTDAPSHAAAADEDALAQAVRRFRQTCDAGTARLGDALGRWLHLRNQGLRDDLIAGLTVALVAVPQALAYAQLAGVPAYYGLYAAILPMIVGALFGSSPQLSTGPTALTALLTAASIAPLAALGSDAFVTQAVLLALIAGVFQIMFGLLRMGVLLNFLSHPVLIGFINAAALIIGLSQLPALLGMPSQQSEHFLLDIWNVVAQLQTASVTAFAFGAAAIAMLALFKYFVPRLPGVLLTLIIVTGISAATGFDKMGGAVVGEIPTGLPTIAMPKGGWDSVVRLLPAGFVLALISFMEAMSSAKAISLRTRQRWDQNRELVGQGLAKVASAFCQSMPVSASLSRSALNAGARSNLSSVISAVGVLLALLLLTSLLYHVPKSALAAIIIVAVAGLIDTRAFRAAWRAKRDDGIAAVATFVATLAFAPYIQNGIVTGALLSLGLLLYRMMRPQIAVLSLNADGILRESWRVDHALATRALGAIRFDGSLQFVTGSYFEDALVRMEQENAQLRFILVQCGGINDIDASGVEVLRNLGDRFRANGLVLAFSSLKPQVREVMDRTGLTERIGTENIFATDTQALDALQARLAQ